ARAMERAEPDRDRRIRTLSGEIVGPVMPGPADVVAEPLRRGSGVATWEARLTQDGQCLARASAVFGRDRRRDEDAIMLAAPVMRPWKEVAVVPHAPFVPRFAQQLEYRSTGPW